MHVELLLTHSFKAPGFNNFTYEVKKKWFHSLPFTYATCVATSRKAQVHVPAWLAADIARFTLQRCGSPAAAGGAGAPAPVGMMPVAQLAGMLFSSLGGNRPDYKAIGGAEYKLPLNAVCPVP